MSEVHYRSCNLCEAICGLEIEHEDGRVVSIRGDRHDPFSRGHICPKAFALRDIYEDADRVRTPLRRAGSGWEKVSWEDAFEDIVGRLNEIRTTYGSDAVGIYQGNPSVHNFGTMLSSGELLKVLKTKNHFSATSVDQLPHHFAAWAMFGHPLLLPIPDIDRTSYFLILGANPVASNGSLMTAPDVLRRLTAISERNGKVILIDPRRTETARVATEHHFITPSADVYFLLSLIHVLFAEKLIKPQRLEAFTDGFSELQKIAARWTPERTAALTGIDAATTTRLAREFAAAESAVCYGRMGLSTQRFGGLCQWLINAINILTGNLDRPGGAMFTTPAFDVLATSKGGNVFDRWRSRVRGLSEFIGELPVAALAEEIETPGDGQIRALITSCGNPVLSTPDGARLARAISALDFFVAIDIYINETTRHADYILPPATGLEVSHYDVIFNLLAIRNTAKYSPPLFEKSPDARFDWEILQELSFRLAGGEGEFKPVPPEQKLALGLKFGPSGLTFDELRAELHGVDLGPLRESLPDRLFTPDKRINLTPDVIVHDIERLENVPAADPDFPFALIGRRHLRDCNSWLHNSPTLMKGPNRCTVQINPADAASFGIEADQPVQVESRVGIVELPAELTDSVARGVVSIPHGYGHQRDGVQLGVAQTRAGASINDLTDSAILDELTGNAAFSSVRVRITPRAEN